MKIKYVSLIVRFLVVSLFFISCSDNESELNTDSLSTEDVVAIIASDDASNDVESVIDDYFEFDEDLSGKSSEEVDAKRPDFLNCRVKTIVKDGDTKTVTLDFGEGCELPNGNILKGKIIIVHKVDTTAPTLTVTYTFENFYVNEISIEGGSTIVKTRENANGNPEFLISFEKTLTWPDGEFSVKKGTKIKEWIEGYETREWLDNVYLITGNWELTFNDGLVCSATIIDILKREATCRYIVSGVVSLMKNERTGTLNFGDGSCDNKAIFINYLGEESEVTLRGIMF